MSPWVFPALVSGPELLTLLDVAQIHALELIAEMLLDR